VLQTDTGDTEILGNPGIWMRLSNLRSRVKQRTEGLITIFQTWPLSKI
jgi:hypothetical protein